MKFKKFLFSLILISVLALYSIKMAQAATYTLDTEQGTQIILDIKVDNINQYTGQMVMKADKITSKSYGWAIEWEITLMGETVTRSHKIYSDPKSDPNGMDFFNAPDVLCPAPVEDYLSSLAKAIGDNWTASETSITYKTNKSTRTITFDANTGIINKYIYEKDDEIIQEYVIAGIPGYDFPLLLGIIAVSIFGSIYIIMKKKIIRLDQS